MVYDRKTKKYIEENELGILKFAYNNVIGRCILKPFTHKWFSNLYSKYLNSKLSKHKIKKFVIKNNIDMSEYVEKDYVSFDDFFTRDLKMNNRKLSNDKSTLVCPCDSKLSIYKIDDDVNFNIKGSIYNVNDLLQDNELASEFKDGYCLVFRLCVDDYHHYYFIDEGKVLDTKYIKGKLHTVRPIAHQNVKVFKENSREYSVLETLNFGKVIQMEVGAMMVGKICNYGKDSFLRGEEKGYFRFGGSTVILLFQKDKIRLDEDLLKVASDDVEVRVHLFENIGRRY
jgi:phosphatidylserine decarboxylase